MTHIINEIHFLGNLHDDGVLEARYPVYACFEPDRVMLIRGNGGGQPPLPTHEEITKFSASSGRRMAKYLRTARSSYRAIATLTYPSDYGITAAEAYNQLDKLFKRWNYLQQAKATPLSEEPSWFWFKEFQSNGQLHFHFFTTHFIHKDWLSKAWAQIVKADNQQLHQLVGTNIQRLTSGRAGMVRYAAKYAKKQEQKAVPKSFGNPGRFWGIIGNNTVSAATVHITLSNEAKNNRNLKLIRQFEELLLIKRRSTLPAFEVKTWQKDVEGYALIGTTIEIKCPIVKERWSKLLAHVTDNAESHDLSPEPKQQPIFHAMRCSTNSVELLRRYRQLQERNYQLRCKALRISSDCVADQRPDNTGERTEEARRNKKFRLEAWAIRRYGQRMGN